MGRILDTKDEILGLEERRESFIILDLERKDAPDKTPAYQPGRMFRGHDRYNYAVKKGEEVWVECGDNQYKAERIVLALNMLEASEHPDRLSEHIFASGDGAVEISKEFLRKLVAFFDNPENWKLLKDGYQS